VRVGDRQLRVRLTHGEERYLLDEGEALDVTVRGEQHTLRPGVPLVTGRPTAGPTAAREASSRPEPGLPA
jgi:hypothetical protein